jgi:hypothetical protein
LYPLTLWNKSNKCKVLTTKQKRKNTRLFAHPLPLFCEHVSESRKTEREHVHCPHPHAPPQKKIYIYKSADFSCLFWSLPYKDSTNKTEVQISRIKSYTDPICELKGTVAPDYTRTILKEAWLDRRW